MHKTRQGILLAAVAGLLTIAPTASAAGSPGYMTFKNRIYHEIRVEIYHSDGKLQKSEVIKSMKNHRFQFSGSLTGGCKDKNRKFSIFKQVDGKLMATGQFGFESSEEGTWGCRMDMKLEGNDEWPPTVELQNTDKFNSQVTFGSEYDNAGWFEIKPNQ
jgi:hypothetical protein